MAHFVGRQLHIRPSAILDEWSVAELIVAFGEYANEMADRSFKTWQSSKGNLKDRPPQYIVQFME